MLPRVVIYNAVSLDGRITGFDVNMELYYGLAGEWKEDATLVGSNTLMKAEDEIPEDYVEAPSPPDVRADDDRSLLVVPDSRGRIWFWPFLRDQPYWRGVLVLCTETTPREYLDYLEDKHIEYFIAGEDHVDMRKALQELRERYGVETVRVDSGGTLNGVLLEEGLVDEVSLLIHPSLVGGPNPKTVFDPLETDLSPGVIDLELVHFEKLKDNLIWLKYKVRK